MNRTAAFDEIQSVLCDQFGVEKENITEHANLREHVGLDSLDLIELLSKMEERFGGEVSDGEVREVRTVGDVLDLVAKMA
ncbi:acyl carrier protein [Streptomyces sp. NY05-11A]|uniref:acyl carrier protein n=1 Tax=Streptomyces soliscabiei TaxID=588897 RepID=UPI0029B7D966|nr:acyl carrier protein [Streptomyces sp. NY05-11A]MDX2679222.1 acyl carrier protein [Streptomyces sp. NY05-11A]